MTTSETVGYGGDYGSDYGGEKKLVDSEGYGTNYGGDYGGSQPNRNTALGTTQLGSRELGAGKVISNVEGTVGIVATPKTELINRLRETSGTVDSSFTSATTEFARIGAFVEQNLSDYFPEPLPTKSDSLLSDIIDANQTIHGWWSDDLVDIIMSHQVENARGRDLDRIGAYFGKIGARGQRNDRQYREFLRGVAQSFDGRGTVSGIKFATAGGLRTDPSNVEVHEDFSQVAYSLLVTAWQQHRVGSIEDLARLSDASGTDFIPPITYRPDGTGIRPRLGPAETEILVDLDGLTVTPEIGPPSVEVTEGKIGGGKIGDGTQIGPERSLLEFNYVEIGTTYTVPDGRRAVVNGDLDLDGTLDQDGIVYFR